MELTGEILIEGQAQGSILRLDRPLSFWGGVDPRTGRITDPRHPQADVLLGGRMLALERTIGSSSSSAILLELIANRCAPAAILIVNVDAILLLGAIVSRELGHTPPPALRLTKADMEHLTSDRHAALGPDGRLTLND